MYSLNGIPAVEVIIIPGIQGFSEDDEHPAAEVLVLVEIDTCGNDFYVKGELGSFPGKEDNAGDGLFVGIIRRLTEWAASG